MKWPTKSKNKNKRKAEQFGGVLDNKEEGREDRRDGIQASPESAYYYDFIFPSFRKRDRYIVSVIDTHVPSSYSSAEQSCNSVGTLMH